MVERRFFLRKDIGDEIKIAHNLFHVQSRRLVWELLILNCDHLNFIKENVKKDMKVPYAIHAQVIMEKLIQIHVLNAINFISTFGHH